MAGFGEKCLDIFITGGHYDRFEAVMAALMVNYDYAQVYESGPPSFGVNGQAAEWAFKNRYPLVLGLPEDMDAMLRRFRYAENRAVAVFNDGSPECREKAAVAKAFAVMADAQYREIAI